MQDLAFYYKRSQEYDKRMRYLKEIKDMMKEQKKSMSVKFKGSSPGRSIDDSKGDRGYGYTGRLGKSMSTKFLLSNTSSPPSSSRGTRGCARQHNGNDSKQFSLKKESLPSIEP